MRYRKSSRTWLVVPVVFGIIAIVVLSLALYGILSTDIATIIITALASTGVVYYSNHEEQHQRTEEEQRKSKLPAFTSFIEGAYKADKAHLMALNDDQKARIEAGARLAAILVTSGSDVVLKKYGEYAKAAIVSVSAGGAKGEEHVYERIVDFEELLFAMRLDLGLTNEELHHGDIARLFEPLIDVVKLQEAAKRTSDSK